MADTSNVEQGTPADLTAQGGRSRLWDGLDWQELQSDALDERTRQILAAMHAAHLSEIDELIREIRRGRSTFEVMPLYAAVGDGALTRQMPSFIDDGEWVLNGIVAWADAAAAANVNVQLTLDSFPFPMAIVAPKADVLARGMLQIPVNEHDTLKLAVTGTAADRVAVLLVFGRLG